MNDPRIPTADWSNRYNSSNITEFEKKIALSLLVFKSSVGPSRDDLNNVSIYRSIINEIKPGSFGVIFTFCDHDDEMSENDYLEWYMTLVEAFDDMP